MVVHGTSGPTSYETIPPARLESSGGVLSTVDMVVQPCDGPRRLRDDDDDDYGGIATSDGRAVAWTCSMAFTILLCIMTLLQLQLR